jgi:hypothetical protein
MLCLKCDTELDDTGRCTECDFSTHDFPKNEKLLRDKVKKIIDKSQSGHAFLRSVNYSFVAKCALTMLQDKVEAERLMHQAEESCETIINFCDVAKAYKLYFDNSEKAIQLLNQAQKLVKHKEDGDYIEHTAKAAGIVCI